MRPFFAYLKKEVLDTARTGKLLVFSLIFALFGIMNPAIAKLTPWLMDALADTMAESGLLMTGVQVDAMTAWTQFFKNIPLALMAFVLLNSDIFTKEYRSGALVLLLTKGLHRRGVVLSKAALLCGLWTAGYWLCFAITYGYSAYFWDNGVVCSLLPAAAVWWLFGVWVISAMVLFSTILSNNAGVLLGVVGTILFAYLLGIHPAAARWTPVMLTRVHPLLTGIEKVGLYGLGVLITIMMCLGSIVSGIWAMNRRQF